MPLENKELFGEIGLTSYTERVHAGRSFRQRLGDRLLVEREQVKRWSRLRAAAEAKPKMHAGTVASIEQAGNVGLDLIDRYCAALGLTFEQVCREAHVPAEDTQPVEGERELVEWFRRATTTAGQRNAVLTTMRAFMARPGGAPPLEARPGPSVTPPDSAAATAESRGRGRKSQTGS
jgi:hypothetical protein